MRLARTLVLSLVASGLVAAVAIAGDPPAKPAAAPQAVPIYNEKADAHVDIAAALAQAKRDHSRVLLQWGANWCGWCKMLHATCGSDKDIKKKLQYEYQVVLIDIGRLDKHMDLATKYGATLKESGVPFLTVLDEDGAVVTNQETSSLEKPKGEEPMGHDVAKVMSFLTKHQAPALKADEVVAKAVAAAKSDGKLVFLHFGAPWCGWCHKLEAWMAKPEIHAILAKAFVDVKVDTDRMTGGQDLLNAHSQGKNGGIPWCEILSADGKALVNSNGPKGNIGFPAQADEIAWFVSMLKTSGATLTDAEIAALEASLKTK
jgi:thiol:disulfide interchange protein